MGRDPPPGPGSSCSNLLEPVPERSWGPGICGSGMRHAHREERPQALETRGGSRMLLLPSQPRGTRGVGQREDNSCSKESEMRLLFFCLVLHINLTLPLRQSSRTSQTLAPSKRRKFKKLSCSTRVGLPKLINRSEVSEGRERRGNTGLIPRRAAGRETGLEQAGKKQIPCEPDRPLGKWGRPSPLGREASALQGGTSAGTVQTPGACEESPAHGRRADAAGEEAGAHPAAEETSGLGFGFCFGS